MVGTWVFLALAFRQLVSSLIKTAEFMVKFSGEYKRCLNTYLMIFRLFQLCTIVFVKFWISHFWSSFETFNQWLMIGKPIVAGWVFDLDQQNLCWKMMGLLSWILTATGFYRRCKGLGMLKTFLCCAKDFTTSVTSFYICFYRVYHWFLCWIAKAAIRVGSSWNSDGVENLTSSSRNKMPLGVLKDLSFARKGSHVVFFIFLVVLDHVKNSFLF